MIILLKGIFIYLFGVMWVFNLQYSALSAWKTVKDFWLESQTNCYSDQEQQKSQQQKPQEFHSGLGKCKIVDFSTPSLWISRYFVTTVSQTKYVWVF